MPLAAASVPRLVRLAHRCLAPLLALAAPCLSAALQWETLETVVPVPATASTAHAQFAFVNTGPQPVTITGIEPGCGCTVPALAKNTYAPGERGVLALEFHPRNREGLNRIPISVATDDGATVTLQFVADVEAAVTFDQRFVFWKGTEPRTPKKMRLTFAATTGGRIDHVTSSDPRFGATFRAVGDTGREYEVEVTPPADALDYAVITVQAQLGPEAAPREFSLVARTMSAPGAKRP